MTERENKNLEELQKDRLQAEISKIKAETDKLSREREEIEKHVNQKWYFTDLAFKIIGLIVAIIVIVASVISIIIPLTQTSNQLAENKIKIAQIKLDSALVEKSNAVSSLEKAKAQKDSLQTLIKLQSAQLDSVTRHQRAEIEVLRQRSKGQTDKNIIEGLRSNIESLEKQIKTNESYKEQIAKLLPALSILSGRVVTKEDGSKYPLEGVSVTVQDGSIKDKTNENGDFKLEIPTNRGVFERVIFSKTGYTEITLNLKPPNQNIEVILEKAQ